MCEHSTETTTTTTERTKKKICDTKTNWIAFGGIEIEENEEKEA